MNDYQHLFDTARAKLKPCACGAASLIFAGTVSGDPHVECGACRATGKPSMTKGLDLMAALDEAVEGWNER